MSVCVFGFCTRLSVYLYFTPFVCFSSFFHHSIPFPLSLFNLFCSFSRISIIVGRLNYYLFSCYSFITIFTCPFIVINLSNHQPSCFIISSLSTSPSSSFPHHFSPLSTLSFPLTLIPSPFCILTLPYLSIALLSPSLPPFPPSVPPLARYRQIPAKNDP